MASKSATGFAISNGLERNMFLRFPVELRFHQRLSTPVLSSRFSVLSEKRLEIIALSAALRAIAA
jgi:hypothetical protein